MIRIPLICALITCATAISTAQERLSGTLPVCAVVGDAPTEDVYTIELHDNGILSVAGVPMTFDACFKGLAKRAKELPGEKVGPIQTSRVNVLIRAAGNLPVAAIERIMRECARPHILAPRIFFGATHRGDRQEGAFAYFLPIDREGAEPILEKVEVYAREGREGSAAGLVPNLKRLVRTIQPKVLQRTAITIEVDGDASWATALGMIDASAHAGIPICYLDCRLTKQQHNAWHTKATRHNLRVLCNIQETRSQVACELGPIIVAKGGDWASPPRVQGGYAGYAASPLAMDFVPDSEPILLPAEELGTTIRFGLGGGSGGKYGQRGGVVRNPEVTPRVRRLIDAGLKWLQQHQDKDGKWDSDSFMKHDDSKVVCDGPGNAVHDVGVTALALLAMLGDGSTMRSGPYKKNVRQGVLWLREQQGVNGLIGTNNSHDFIYDHAIATCALIEAYGLSEYKLFKHPAQQAVNYLEAHRNVHQVWRYQPRDNDNDTSVTNWCAMAYIAGRDFGLDVNDKALANVGDWLDQVADHASGHHGYSKRGEPSVRHPGNHIQRFPIGKNEPLTGSSLLVRYLLGQTGKTHPVLPRAARLVASKPPVWSPKTGHVDLYSWFWSSHALYQAGGEHWRGWSRDLVRALSAGQRKEGAAKGSWDPVGVWGEDGGRVATTALATLSLQSSYRFARKIR